jgi:ABC-2 type transport system permease protein
MSELVLQRERSKFSREVNAVVTILARDITLAFKSPMLIIMSLAMPLIMMGMLGGTLSQNMAGGLGFDYGQFIMVGMMVNMLFMTTTTNMSSLVDDHETDFMQEMLVSPVSRYAIVIGKIFGAAFTAIVSMLGTVVVGLFMGITLRVGQLLLLLLLSPLMCLSAGALAMLLVGFIKNNRVANVAMMAVTMPQMFLSGAIIPISNNSGILLALSRVLPMTYCLDLARAVVYAGTPEYSQVVLFNPVVNFAAIAALTAVCLIVGTFFFARTEKNR